MYNKLKTMNEWMKTSNKGKHTFRIKNQKNKKIKKKQKPTIL